MKYSITLENEEGDIKTEVVVAKTLREAAIKVNEMNDDDFIVISIKTNNIEMNNIAKENTDDK